MPRPGSVPLDTPLHREQKGEIAPTWKGWLTAISSLFSATSAVATPVVTASPFVYQNAGSSLQQAIISGPVSSISFSRDGVTYYAASSPVILSGGDYVKITYVGPAPVLVVSPL